jgi:hypothetical protein
MLTPSTVELVAPVVNLNGSSATSLIEDTRKAYNAAQALLTALSDMNPHGRDYQTAPAGTYERARQQHSLRIDAVNEIIEELGIVLNKIYKQRR